MIRISTSNLMPGLSNISVSSEVSPDYTRVNLAVPAQPMLPWRTTALGVQYAVIDLSTPNKAVDVIHLVNANFTSVTIEGSHDGNTWTGYSKSATLTPGRNYRYNWAHDTHVTAPAFAFRYMRVYIPSQQTTDGASYYSLGGLWIGLWASVPRDLDLPYTAVCIEPGALHEPQSRAWEQWVGLGDERMEIAITRRAITGDTIGASGDELDSWLTLERLTRNGAAFLVQPEALDSRQAWVVRRSVSIGWQQGLQISNAPLVFRELMRP